MLPGKNCENTIYIFQIAKVKNYNLNVTEVRDSDFKNAFPGIFNLTVGILNEIFRSHVCHVDYFFH